MRTCPLPKPTTSPIQLDSITTSRASVCAPAHIAAGVWPGIGLFPATPGMRGFPYRNGEGPTHVHRPLTSCPLRRGRTGLPFLLALLFLALLLVGILFLFVRLARRGLGFLARRLRLRRRLGLRRRRFGRGNRRARLGLPGGRDGLGSHRRPWRLCSRYWRHDLRRRAGLGLGPSTLLRISGLLWRLRAGSGGATCGGTAGVGAARGVGVGGDATGCPRCSALPRCSVFPGCSGGFAVGAAGATCG